MNNAFVFNVNGRPPQISIMVQGDQQKVLDSFPYLLRIDKCSIIAFQYRGDALLVLKEVEEHKSQYAHAEWYADLNGNIHT